MKLFIIGFFTVFGLLACSQSQDIEETMPLDTTRSDCAADGAGCEQFNPDL